MNKMFLIAYILRTVVIQGDTENSPDIQYAVYICLNDLYFPGLLYQSC